jgi:hypothetical protein
LLLLLKSRYLSFLSRQQGCWQPPWKLPQLQQQRSQLLA